LSNHKSSAGLGRAGTDDRLILDFDDNLLLTELYGAHDANLVRIEEALGISAVNRGNRLVLSGDPQACQRAQEALDSLYERLKAGQEVTRGDVDGALRMSAMPVNTSSAKGKTTGAKGKTTGAKGMSGGEGKSNGQNVVRTQKRGVNPRSPTQAAYLDALMRDELVIGTGPAGTGKTYLAVAVAAAMLVEGKVDRIILSRPAVEAGESLGFLPGDMRDKVDPYLRPLYDALYDMLPGPQVMRSMESGEIEIAPLAFMRGRTLANSFVILDEAQNATPMQMKMFLTRMGENSRMVITGDPSQVDLPFGAKSGLRDALEILPKVKGVALIKFTDQDVVRHDMVTRIVRAYNKRDRTLTDGDPSAANKAGKRPDGKPETRK
jgi:phosphate starvation-inducible PhoH-like protein